MLAWLRRTFGAAPTPPDPNDLVLIRDASPRSEADVLGARLDAVGIEAWVTPAVAQICQPLPWSDRTGWHGGGGWLSLSVRRADAERAEAVLAEPTVDLDG